MLLKTSFSVKKCLTLFLILVSLSSSANLIIYEVYAGGGNSEAAYQDDFVVLYNNGATAINTGTNWSLQYESGTGDGTWDIFPLPSTTINSGAYYFIKIETSGSDGFEFMSNNASTSAIGGSSGLSAAGGKLGVFENPTGIPVAFIGSDPTIVVSTTLLLRDMLGYGNADASETSPAQNMHTNSTVLYRTGGDTDDNSADFARNSDLSTGAFDVNLVSFDGKAVSKAINLNWQTSSETQNEGFRIQKSRDAVNFESIGFVEGNIHKNEISTYNFTDLQPYKAINYYRLEQRDLDGTVEYSKIIQVYWESNIDFVSIYPNPLRQGNELNINKSESLKLSNIFNQKGQNTSNCFEKLEPGSYYLKFISENNQSITKRLVIH